MNKTHARNVDECGLLRIPKGYEAQEDTKNLQYLMA